MFLVSKNLCVGVTEIFSDTKGLASSEATVLTGICDPSVDVLCIHKYLWMLYVFTQMVTHCIHFYSDIFAT